MTVLSGSPFHAGGRCCGDPAERQVYPGSTSAEKQVVWSGPESRGMKTSGEAALWMRLLGAYGPGNHQHWADTRQQRKGIEGERNLKGDAEPEAGR